MTQNEIIEMARQVCDIAIDNRGRHTFVCDEYGLEEFANLIIESLKPSLQTEFEKMFMEGAAAERKQIIDMAQSSEFNRMRGEFSPTSNDLVNAIKARGEA